MKFCLYKSNKELFLWSKHIWIPCHMWQLQLDTFSGPNFGFHRIYKNFSKVNLRNLRDERLSEEFLEPCLTFPLTPILLSWPQFRTPTEHYCTAFEFDHDLILKWFNPVFYCQLELWCLDTNKTNQTMSWHDFFMALTWYW